MRALTTEFVQLADTVSVPLSRPVIGCQVFPTKSGLFVCSVSLFYMLTSDAEVSGQLSIFSHSGNVDVTITGSNDGKHLEGPVYYETNAGPIVLSPTDTIAFCGAYEGPQTAGRRALNLAGVLRAPSTKKTVIFAAIETTGLADGLTDVSAAFSAVEL